jgi:translation initiation factor 6 (eIF-6)
MGNGFVSIGIIANSKGYVVGEGTSGIEIARIEEGLGYLG